MAENADVALQETPERVAEALPTRVKAPPAVGIGSSSRTWHAVSIVTGLLLGFAALLLVHKFLGVRLYHNSTQNADFAVFTTPNDRLATAVIVPAIHSAQKEILVIARDLTSKAMLEALAERVRTGRVEVRIILSPDRDNQSAIRWIRSHHGGDVYIDSAPTYDQFLVIDRSKVLLGATPFTADAPASTNSVGIAVENPLLGQELAKIFLQRAIHPATLEP